MLPEQQRSFSSPFSGTGIQRRRLQRSLLHQYREGDNEAHDCGRGWTIWGKLLRDCVLGMATSNKKWHWWNQLCKKMVSINMELYIQHGILLMISSLKWVVTQLHVTDPVFNRPIFNSLGLDMQELLSTVADRFRRKQDAETLVKPRLKVCVAGALYFRLSESHSNGMSAERCTPLKRLLGQHSNVFHAWCDGKPCKITASKLVINPNTHTVQGRPDRYSLEKCHFMPRFVAHLKTLGLSRRPEHL